MTPRQVNKLYDQLKPSELASLAFGAALRIDGAEFDTAYNSVERRLYECPHTEYITRMQGLIHLSAIYGILYWKTSCQLAVMVSLHGEKDDFVERTQGHRDRLAAMDEALVSICERLKVGPESVYQFAECADYRPDLGGEPSVELIDQYTALFEQVAYLSKAV